MTIVRWFIFFLPVLCFAGLIAVYVLIKMGYADKPVRIKRWMTGAGVALALAIAVPVTCVINDRNEKSCVERRADIERSILHQIEVYLEERGIVDEGLSCALADIIIKEKAYYFEVEDELPTIDVERMEEIIRGASSLHRHSVTFKNR